MSRGKNKWHCVLVWGETHLTSSKINPNGSVAVRTAFAQFALIRNTQERMHNQWTLFLGMWEVDRKAEVNGGDNGKLCSCVQQSSCWKSSSARWTCFQAIRIFGLARRNLPIFFDSHLSWEEEELRFLSTTLHPVSATILLKITSAASRRSVRSTIISSMTSVHRHKKMHVKKRCVKSDWSVFAFWAGGKCRSERRGPAEEERWSTSRHRSAFVCLSALDLAERRSVELC